jgi:KaiC/GvpD/RAD55 family RecA-like ATPase
MNQHPYLSACGTFRIAVHGLMSFSRAVWSMCGEGSSRREGRTVNRAVAVLQLEQRFNTVAEAPALERAFAPLVELLQTADVCWPSDDDTELVIRPFAVNALELLRSTLKGVRPDHELRYFAMQNIRYYYRCEQSAKVAHDLHALARGVNTLIASKAVKEGRTRGVRTTLSLSDGLMPCLTSVLDQHPTMSNAVCSVFLECCRVLYYLHLSAQVGYVEIRTAQIDAEYILSRLFGLPTAIPGLDDLFGGGGLMLMEAGPGWESERIGGRAVLTVGPFGTGKSLLSLQMAVEVARKGGVAWVMPLEQSTQECLYALQSTGGLPDTSPLRVATSVPDAIDLLENPDATRGALILLRSIKESFRDFVAAFDEHVRLMHKYPLRLIVVDPVSALSQRDTPDEVARRAATLELFESVKQRGTNIWLVAEDELPGESSRYEQNIADTVIKVSVESRHGYSQRYIEITKSRLQREQRGRHAFTIGPGRGITVYPSPAAVRSRIKTRTMLAPGIPIKSGLPSLDAILGATGLHYGDVVVLRGPSGCSKTEVGLSFLLESSQRRGAPNDQPQRALLVSARDNEATLRHVLERVEGFRRRREASGVQTNRVEVRIVVIEGGYVKPGYILQRILDEFQQAQLAGVLISRVMVDSVPHWDLTCPYVREDNTFGDTLIDLLRRHRVTTLLTCGHSDRHTESILSRAVLGNADCLIDFERVEFKGLSHIMVRVSHTRDMQHRREYFELSSDARTLELKTASTLLRVEPGGRVSPVKVILFLDAESEAHETYNRSLLESVRSVLSRDAELQQGNPANIRNALGLASSSAIDELQIVQLSEFQVPPLRARDGTWRRFDRADVAGETVDDLLPRLRERVQTKGGLVAIPMFVNVGVLACRRSFGAPAQPTWEELATLCAAWEDGGADREPFFDYPRGDESYNCLFFEILHELSTFPGEGSHKRSQPCALKAWVTSEAASTAMVTMHRLCTRAYWHSMMRQGGEQRFPRVNPHACVWRHWYSSLNVMMADMSVEERSEIRVYPLPNGWSVSGDTFLGVPGYAVAPDVGANLIRLFTSQEAELNRLELGIGLPTRARFYQNDGSAVDVSPYFTMDSPSLQVAVTNCFRRSWFGCYSGVSGLLASHLRSVVAIRPKHEGELFATVQNSVDRLRQRLDFIGQGSCPQCGEPADRQRGE